MLAFGVEPYESLAESLGFMKRLHGGADAGSRHTHPGLFSGRKGGW